MSGSIVGNYKKLIDAFTSMNICQFINPEIWYFIKLPKSF